MTEKLYRGFLSKGNKITMRNEEYLKKNIIAYIGNKRNLLNLIKESIIKTGILNNKNALFLDLFAGSGSVSRLAKFLGFRVFSNDWEYYSLIINKAFIGLDADFLDESFKKLGGLNKTLEILNNLTLPKNKDKYISTYYCPKEDSNPDLFNERMFYTNYNGKKIDAIKSKIDEWKANKFIDENEEYLLLALLLYESSTRSNTSGVFKGFHCGFGGTNADALSRILKPVELNYPILINGEKAEIYKEDALKLVNKLKNVEFDIVYLDPPYNQHQYGSNYHLLNTIALNDKPKINKNILINGKKINKSAIRKDWIKTKSTFCYKRDAKEDFKKIIENIKTKYILVSYSTDGIISFDEMLKILSDKGKLDIVLSEYVKFRGGKQAITTQVKNIEFVLIVNAKEKGSIEDISRIKKVLLKNKIKMFSKKNINIFRAEERGFNYTNDITSSEKILIKKYFNKNFRFNIINNKIEIIAENNFNDFSLEILNEIFDDLEYITNLTKEDEIYLAIENIFKYYKQNLFKEALEIFKEIPYYLSKFNNKKNLIPSLKSIVAVLEMLIQTLEMWKQKDILSTSFFRKFEKILFLKLNYEPFFETKSKNKTNEKDINRIKDLKRTITHLYEYILQNLEKEEIDEKKRDYANAAFMIKTGDVDKKNAVYY